MRRIAVLATSLLAIVLLFADSAEGEIDVAVVTGTRASPLEQFAAGELCHYLEKLFDVRTRVEHSIPRGARYVFLVGRPDTNECIDRAQFGKPSEEGFVLKTARSDGRVTIDVGGGSPRSTLWAVYALAEQWGARFLLHGDVLPPRRQFQMPDHDTLQEPLLRIRQWRVVNEHAMGPAGWGIADYRPVIDQLAKLRFNRLLVYIWPGQPFLPLEYRGIRQTSGTLFFGGRYPITDDMVGRALFGSEKEFWNPDLPPHGDAAALSQAAVRHVRSLIDYAHARGMDCVMPVHLTDFPREFKPLLAHMRPVDMIGTPTIGPGADSDLDDPELAGLARSVLATTIKTYPQIDGVVLDLPEWRAWVNQYARAWTKLDAKYRLSKVRTLDDILAAARARRDYPGGAERAVNEVKADIAALYFFDKVLSEPGVNVAPRKIILSSLAEELDPILVRILPAGSETLNFIDYTPSRILNRRGALRDVPAHAVASSLIYTLHDDNIGVLPQLTTHSLAELTHEIERLGWAGFSTRYWLIGDHDPCVAFISQAAWDSAATPESVYADQLAHVCGQPAVADGMRLFHDVETATRILEWHGLGLSYTAPGMMLKFWSPGQLSPELQSVRRHYQSALAAAQRAAGRSTADGTAYLQYWIGRLRFGIGYLDAIEAVRGAASAESVGESAKAARETRQALDCLTRALESYALVARDRSDKGAIAVMNEYAVRPLRAKLAGMQQQSAPASKPAVVASGFKSTKVYQSKQRPSHTSWVSLFPSRDGKWFLSCAEVTTSESPQPRASKQHIYEMSLPRGYDSSKYSKEQVLLKSDQSLQHWTVVARNPIDIALGAFAQAQTADGSMLRFVWACLSPDPAVKTCDIYYRSSDEGKTWKKMPAMVSDRFAWYPHRLRTLRDGTLVLAAPRGAKWGKDTEYPIRAAIKLDTVSDMEMMLFFSHDQGHTWSNPLPVFSGQTVSETDFVELPDGNLLLFNNSIFANPGRQFVYRDGDRFTPGPLERVRSGTVPETVCLAADGLLVGCHRPGTYYWSDDLGRNWHPLDGASSTIEVYQPWIVSLGKGNVACAGHYGADDPIKSRDQFISLHTFHVEVLRKTSRVKLWIERDFDERDKRFPNAYTISLTSNGTPLPEKNIAVWYVARYQPGYDSFNATPLEQRMKAGGKSLTLRTNAAGKARLLLPEFDAVRDINQSYQLLIRFNPDHQYPELESAELPQLEYYANSGLDP